MFEFVIEIVMLKLIVEVYHDKEVNATHQKGSIYLGYRNGYLFSYRVNNEKEKFSEILYSLDLMHHATKGSKRYFFSSFSSQIQKFLNYNFYR